MKIIHYALGFPPYRSGGLTKFCMDLMLAQQKLGDKVAMLWPGRMEIIGHRTRIVKTVRADGIESLEVVNPLPVSYDEGILETGKFMLPGNLTAYDALFENEKPDILHLHTFMGMHAELLKSAKAHGVKVVFTTHDFFPVCPKVTLFAEGVSCTHAMDCSACRDCNRTALPLWKIRMLQSAVYRSLKDSKPVKALRSRHRQEFFDSAQEENLSLQVGKSAEYLELRDYYKRLLQEVDVIHYNSSLTKKVYETYLKPDVRSEIIPISHGNISDHRQPKRFHEKLHLSFLAGPSGAKGYFILKEALDDLWKKRQDFVLNVYFHQPEPAPYMCEHDRYSYDELEKVMSDTDLLICPSVWYETFGFTVQEALSFGVPVLLSDTVGAADILPEGAGILIEKITPEKIRDAIDMLDWGKLESMNNVICASAGVITVQSMAEEIRRRCYIPYL